MSGCLYSALWPNSAAEQDSFGLYGYQADECIRAVSGFRRMMGRRSIISRRLREICMYLSMHAGPSFYRCTYIHMSLLNWLVAFSFVYIDIDMCMHIYIYVYTYTYMPVEYTCSNASS